MQKTANRQVSKVLAGLLAVVMLLSSVSVGLYVTFAAGVKEFSVKLVNGTAPLSDSIAVTLTNTADTSKTQTQSTENGVAVFNDFVEENATYSVSVASVTGYEDVTDYTVTVGEGDTETTVNMTALEKTLLTGTVCDENGKPYSGAAVKLSGYLKGEVSTDEKGAFSFEVFKGKDYTLTATAKEEKYSEATASIAAVAENKTCNLTFAVKKFSVNTSSNNSDFGEITPSFETEYGSNAKITANAKDGYRIGSFSVNGKVQDKASGQKSFDFDIDPVKEKYSVSVEFVRKTYKIEFKIGANGKVTYNGNDAVDGGSVSVEESTDPAKVEVVATPKEHYRVSKVTVDGIEETFAANNQTYSGTFTMNTDHTFAVEFKLNTFEVKVESDENGTATVNNTTVEYEGTATITITPNDGYNIVSVLVNNVESKASCQTENGQTYTLNVKITEDTSIKITYAEIPVIPPEKFNEFINWDNTNLVKSFSDEKQNTYVYKKGSSTVLESRKNGIRVNEVKTGIAYATKQYNINKSILIEKLEVYENWVGWICVLDSKKNDKAIQIIIDNTAPIISKVESIKGWANTDKGVTVSGNVTDNEDNNDKYNPSSGLSHVVWNKGEALKPSDVLDVQKDNRTDIDENGNFKFKVKDDQKETYFIYAVDIAGNVSDAKTVTVQIDTTKPEITGFQFNTQKKTKFEEAINFLSFGIFCKDTVYVTVSATDKLSGVKSISLFVDGSENSPFATKDFDNEAAPGVNSDVTATFELTEDEFKDGKNIYAKAVDKAGNSESKKPSECNEKYSNLIKISTEAPTVEIAPVAPDKPTYTDENKNNWYNANTTVNVTVSDDKAKAGIYSVSIKLNGAEVVTYSANKNDINCTAEGENVIEVTATNNCGVATTATMSVFIDTTAPTVKDFYITNNVSDDSTLKKVINILSFGMFYNDTVKVTVTASDVDDDKNSNIATSGVKEIALYGDGEMIGKPQTCKDGKCTFTISADEITENNDGKPIFNKKLSATATDNVGNMSSATSPTTTNSNIPNSGLMIETTKPDITVKYAEAAKDKNTNTADKNDWYNDDVEFNIAVADNESGLGSVEIKINDTEITNDIIAKPIDPNDKKEEVSEKEEKTTAKTFVVNTNNDEVKINEDGSYKLCVKVTDNAGNVATYEKTIYKDIDDPAITGFTFAAENYKEGKEDKATVEVTDYGFYFKNDTEVTVSAKDDGPSSGIKTITYYTVDIDSGKSEETTVQVNKENKITFTVKANFKGQIYAKATDNVDNAPAEFVNPNSAIAENTAKHESENHIDFAKAQTENKTSDNSELYANDVPVEITVTDTYSGIRSIEWSVNAPYDTDNNQNGTVTVGNDKKTTGDDGWTQVTTEANLVYVMKKTVTVKNNSNNIVVKVKMTDRAGNVSEKEISFAVDKTAPTIEVTYDNNTPDDTYADIFKADRKATVKVTERNFNAKDVVYKITNTDGVIPTIGNWTTHTDSEDPDKTYHTGEILYHADGDYTFNISYTDLAKNKAADFAEQKFTIDQTLPTVSVSYDNMSSQNGNYYKANRIATVTILEHNFDASRVHVIGSASNDGTAVAFPAISAWTDNGDTHTATILYNADAKYSFDIEFSDKAGNSIADFAAQEFFVDKTAPTLEISGVTDKSANNGTVAPVITFSDTNFNGNAVTYTLTGVNNGKVTYPVSLADITNGQTVTFADFEKAQNIDDIYTLTAALTDMAGNETTQSITFSVNRFGSVYDLGTLQKLIGKYLQNEEDIVFTEINVDSLKKGETKIKLTKNGTPKDLAEGTDYTVTESGGNGQWSKYQYTVKSSLFADDGRYSISVYSVDAAGNVNENIDETKKAEISFGVDKTKPVIVPIDFESGMQYPVEVKTVSVEIKDNLVLEGVKVYLNGSEIQYNKDGETYTFDIPEKNEKQNVKITAVDAAGNEYELLVEDFLVSTNMFVRWFNNTPLFIGSIAGVIVLCAAIVIFILIKRKKSSK